MIGQILGISALIKIIPIFIGGYLNDRLGRKRILFTFTYLLACVVLIRAFAPDYRFLLIASVLEALFMGIRTPFQWSIGLMSVDAVLSILLLREPEVKAE